MTALAESPDLTPGAMAVTLERTLPSGGVITFESAPAGWLTKDGKPRRKDWRRYRYANGDAKRIILPSVTTICGDVLPKPGLPPWSEAHGIIGALEAVQRGLLDPAMSTERPPKPGDHPAVQIVRKAHLGADDARDTAADRGLNVHAILEQFMNTGRGPNPADHPEPHRPFIRGLVRWLLWADPEPVAVELLVADPDRGYAGRADLIARIGDRLTLVDLKTNPYGAIWDSAHLQVELLRQAEERHGEHRPDGQLLVSVDATGSFREMQCVASPTLAEHALRFHAEVRDLCSKCESGNKIQRQVLQEAA